MAVDVLNTIVINRPIVDVSQYAADPDNAPAWYENIKSVEWRTPRPLQLGTRIDFVAEFLGRRLAYTYEVVDYVPGRRLTMRKPGPPFPMETTYGWGEENGGTRMSLQNRGTLRGFSAWLAPLMATMIRRANRKDLALLKRRLEAQVGEARIAPHPVQGAGMMERRVAFAIDRRSFLGGAGRLAVGALGAGAMLRQPGVVRAQNTAGVAHPASARLADRLRTSFTFQISVDVATIEQGLRVAGAALAGGITILEMGTPLLKNQGVANVVPAFRKQFPEALLLADMKTMDGGGFEARAVYSGGANIIDFLALSGVDTAKSICAVRDEFRRSGPAVPRLAFADILVPHQGPAGQAIEVARQMLEAGVDGVGVHLQADARRADPKLMEGTHLGDIARTIFQAVGREASVQVVGGLSTAQAKSLAQAGLRAFVISGNLGQPDTRARYDLPPQQIERAVAEFIAAVSGA